MKYLKLYEQFRLILEATGKRCVLIDGTYQFPISGNRGYILIKTNPKYWEGFYKEDKSDGLFSEYLIKTSDFIKGDGKTNLCPPSIWNVGPDLEIVIGGNRRLVTFACLGALPKVWVCKSL